MGFLFQRRRAGGKSSPIWSARYRPWDPRARDWGRQREVSLKTRNKKEAERRLAEIEDREQRRSRGLEACVVDDAKLSSALTEFLDSTHVVDDLTDRNRRVVHPLLGIEVMGTAWWIRTLDFARDVARFLGPDRAVHTLTSDDFAGFDRWLGAHGGAHAKGVGRSTRFKVLHWFRRFLRWCVRQCYLAADISSDYKIPAERAERKARALAPQEVDQFWSEYERLSAKGRVRVGLALELGARAGEVETVRVCDVDPEQCAVTRRIWKGSNVDAVTARVSQQLMQLLMDWIASNGLSGEDRLLPIRCQTGAKFLRRWGTSMRGLRRTVLTRLQDNHVPLRVIQEVAAHTKLTTTARYLDVAGQDVSEAIRHVWPRRK